MKVRPASPTQVLQNNLGYPNSPAGIIYGKPMILTCWFMFFGAIKSEVVTAEGLNQKICGSNYWLLVLCVNTIGEKELERFYHGR